MWIDGSLLARWPENDAPTTSECVAPIQVGGRKLGELRVAGLDRTIQYRLDSEARLLERIGELEGDLEAMTAELIDAQDYLLALYDLTQLIRSQVGLGATLRSLAQAAARLLKTESAVALLLPTIVHDPVPLLADSQMVALFTQVQQSGRELVLSGGPEADLPPGVDNLCVMPIRIRDTVEAALGLVNKTGGFGAPELKLARAVAEQAGAQIEHALLHQEQIEQARLQTEMDLARNVQLTLLPKHRPSVRGLELFAESRPAFQVGGDFYDFVDQPDQPLIFSIGDVAGKGISAALVMGMIHAIASSAARFMPEPSPLAVLRRTNDDLYDNFTKLSTFATAFVGQFDPHARQLHFANAGHAPVIFCPKGGPARLIEADSPPIGVLPMTLAENYSLPFGPGDTLVVATDGFNESMNATGEMFGYGRLLELVEELHGEPAEVIAYGLLAAVESFSAGHPQDDDQTLVVLKGVAL
ncbi:MAG TPA: GAF domain-containing SpoIIE family protein phosphatase [Roseiflexaceae bacterium]|nr:GAF domain-containing SpoIIE family protein phosphatase [Roseiflexaceae bacterium]